MARVLTEDGFQFESTILCPETLDQASRILQRLRAESHFFRQTSIPFPFAENLWEPGMDPSQSGLSFHAARGISLPLRLKRSLQEYFGVPPSSLYSVTLAAW